MSLPPRSEVSATDNKSSMAAPTPPAAALTLTTQQQRATERLAVTVPLKPADQKPQETRECPPVESPLPSQPDDTKQPLQSSQDILDTQQLHALPSAP